MEGLVTTKLTNDDGAPASCADYRVGSGASYRACLVALGGSVARIESFALPGASPAWRAVQARFPRALGVAPR